MLVVSPKPEDNLLEAVTSCWVRRDRNQLPVAVTYLGIQSVGQGKIEKVVKVGLGPIWKNLVINDSAVFRRDGATMHLVMIMTT